MSTSRSAQAGVADADKLIPEEEDGLRDAAKADGVESVTRGARRMTQEGSAIARQDTE